LAALGGELAVPCYLQSASAGRNSPPRPFGVGVSRRHGAMILGSRATVGFELGQGRKAAAIRRFERVPRGRLRGVTDPGAIGICLSLMAKRE